MEATIILVLFLLAVLVALVVDLTLDILNMRHVRQHAAEVPDFFRDHIDATTYAQSVSYTLAKAKFGLVQKIFDAILIVVILLSGILGSIDRSIGLIQTAPYTHGVIYILLLSLLLSIVALPFNLYSTFVIEERFGFNNMTLPLWVKDIVKGLLLSVLLLTPLLYGLFWFMDTTGSLWWLWAFGFVAGFQLLIVYLYPVFIAPLFNRFNELENGPLKEAIYQLAQRVGFKTAGIFVMDGSRRSSHGNAYFTGFGKSKRIVLFDTLIENLSALETVAVLAHEIGHEKRLHVKKMLALSLLITLVGFYVLHLLLDYTPLFHAFGFHTTSPHAALVILSLAASPLMFFLTPLFSLLSRKYEYEADTFAVRAVETPKPLQQALFKLSKKNLSNLTPHPLYSAFHYSHPTLLERVRAMERVAGND